MRVPVVLRRLAFGLGRRLPPGTVRLINLARGIDAPRPVELPPGRRVVILAPHPDDELIGAGGTLAKHVAAGHQVDVVMMTSGEASASFVGQDDASARNQREGEARSALGEIGLAASHLVLLRLPERGLEEAGPEALAAALAELEPDLVYCPSPGDGHAGHAATARLLAGCVARLGGLGHVALYEVMTPIPPNVVVDVTKHMPAKRAGLAHYASALASVDFVRTSEALAAYRSVHALHGRGFAEAFTLLRPGEFVDLVAAVTSR